MKATIIQPSSDMTLKMNDIFDSVVKGLRASESQREDEAREQILLDLKKTLGDKELVLENKMH